jgi:hypothetical protein
MGRIEHTLGISKSVYSVVSKISGVVLAYLSHWIGYIFNIASTLPAFVIACVIHKEEKELWDGLQVELD